MTPTRTQAATLAVTGTAFFMVLLDVTVVSVALPSIRSDLDTSVTGLGWVVTGYTLPFAALLLTCGTLGDRLGGRRVLLVGIAVFTVGSATCALAPTLPALALGRAVQGIGGAAVAPTGLALAAGVFPDERERARAIGLWSGATGMALAAGPLLGGVLIEGVGDWRAVFWVNVPLGLAALLVGRRLLPETGARRHRSLDLPGQVLAVLALALLVLAIAEADDRGWASVTATSSAIGAACCTALFLARESRCDEPMLPLSFFRAPLFSVGALATLVVGWVLTSHSFFLSQFFQEVQRVDPLASGLRTLPTTVGIFVLAPVAGRLAARFDYRTPVAGGAVLAGTGVLALTLVRPDTHYLALVVPLGLVGVGFGLMLSPLVGAAVSSVPAPDAGVAGAANNVARQLGGTLGIAVLSALVAARLGPGPQPGPQAGTHSGDATGAVDLTTALHLVFLVNGLLLLTIAVVVALRLRRPVPLDPSRAALRREGREGTTPTRTP